ncbi:MAG: acyltransferase [Paracoccaceae bacterium]|nr:acyltransferase [Paracoccaceae bacterium]MDG1738641.1 acyltransferase [Paracoccaceae bacterium]MDG2259083.1 acyltransferase [Paracoccaceae bacterium]
MRDLFDESTGNRAFIDLLRTIGILQVVLFHVIHGIVRFAPPSSINGFVERMPWWMNFAWQAYGVDMIFVISAFLLTFSLLIEKNETGKISIRGYYARRLIRILPLYYIALAVFAVAQGNSLSEIITSALFIGYIVSDFNVIPVGWSMEVMILYYIALPWLIMALAKIGRPLLWLSLAIIATALWRYLYLVGQPEDPAQFFLTMVETKDASPAGFELYFRPWFRLPAFLMGSIMAYLIVQNRIPKTRVTPILAVLLIVPILWMPVQNRESWVYSNLSPEIWAAYWAIAPVIFARAFGFLIAWGLLRGRDSPWKIHSAFRAFSKNIFAVYLFHMPFLAVGAVAVFMTTDPIALGSANLFQVIAVFVATAGLTYLFAWPLTKFVEQPLQNKIRRMAK